MLLEKKTGIHLYVNVKNFPSIVRREENETDDLDHSLHALNIYFRSIEKKCHNLNIEIEKVTSARLHLFIEGDLENSDVIKKLYEISLFSINASRKMRQIPKYQSIKKFEVHIGACDGDSYYYEFNDSQEEYKEITSIGYPANVAAKLESLSYTNNICVPYNLALGLKMNYPDLLLQKGTSGSLTKYDLNSYYLIDLSTIKVDLNTGIYNEIVSDANYTNLKDINFEDFKSSFKFDDLSVKNCKCGYAAIIMADVRGFTKKFNKDGSNLEDMTFKAEQMYAAMYNVMKENGIHVQFQGDREVAIFAKSNLKEALISALILQDKIRDLGLKCGIGINYGYIYASRVGIRGEKDNVIIGESAIDADKLEDLYAKENETVLSNTMYSKMKDERKNDEILSYFTKSENGVYKTSLSYIELVNKISLKHSNDNYSKGNYNGAWRKE